MGSLTALGIKAIKAGAKRTRYADGQNLYLVVDATTAKRPTGARRWLFIYRFKGQQKELGLGGVDKVSLVAARAKAEDARDLLGRGIDPMDDRKVRAAAASAIPTFAKFAETHIKTQAPGWKGAKTEAGWRRSAFGHAAALADVPVDQITTEDVIDVLTPIWETLPESAQKAQMRIETILDAAKARGHRSGDNPARWRGHLQHLLAPRRKLTRGSHRSLPYAALPKFMADLAWRDGTGARGLEFAILTAAREAMVTGASWSEVNLEAATWTVSSVRMKGLLKDLNAKAFIVPLSAQALALLTSARSSRTGGVRPSDLIFPGSRPGTQMSNATMDTVLERMGVDAVPHGFRATFKTWAEERTNHPREIIEMALAHKVGDATEQAYRRGQALEKRARLMAAWGSYAMSKTTSRGRLIAA